MFKRSERLVLAVVVSWLVFGISSSVQAEVDLELRPAVQSACPDGTGVNDVVQFGLYAIDTLPSNPYSGSIATVTAIIWWDPTKLELVGRIDNQCNYELYPDDGGPYCSYKWLYSRFPDDKGIDGINDGCLGADHDPQQPEGATCVPYNDGNAWYHAFAQFAPNPPAWATAEGLLVTTFRFRLLGPDSGDLELVAQYLQSNTRVSDGMQPGTIVTGDLGPPVEVTGCPPPTVEAEGCRYLAVTPAECNLPVALAVTGEPVDPAVACVDLMYVQADGTLGWTPVEQTPEEWGTVHVHGGEIIPSTTYYVEAVCNQADEVRSAPMMATTWAWGDADNDDDADLDDVLLMLFAFRDNCNIEHKENCTQATFENMNIYGRTACEPDEYIDLDDLLSALQAFQELEFVDSGCYVPCGG